MLMEMPSSPYALLGERKSPVEGSIGCDLLHGMKSLFTLSTQRKCESQSTCA